MYLLKSETPSKKIAKIQLILDKAAVVFKRKGFDAVTMQDIVDECGISRGGLYKYYGNTAEIFETILVLNFATNDILNGNMEQGKSFMNIFSEFLECQKRELLNTDDSLRVATYEYFLKNRASAKTQKIMKDNLYINTQFVENLLKYGIETGEIKKVEHINTIAMNLVVWLEGLNLTSIAASLDEKAISAQLESIKKIILNGGSEWYY